MDTRVSVDIGGEVFDHSFHLGFGVQRGTRMVQVNKPWNHSKRRAPSSELKQPRNTDVWCWKKKKKDRILDKKIGEKAQERGNRDLGASWIRKRGFHRCSWERWGSRSLPQIAWGIPPSIAPFLQTSLSSKTVFVEAPDELASRDRPTQRLRHGPVSKRLEDLSRRERKECGLGRRYKVDKLDRHYKRTAGVMFIITCLFYFIGWKITGLGLMICQGQGSCLSVIHRGNRTIAASAAMRTSALRFERSRS